MENSYIQQLQSILQTQYNISQNEIDSIIENYRVTVQTIIDETNNEMAVIEQLGSPHTLAEEIANEFHFTPRTAASSIENNSTNQKHPAWVFICSIIFAFVLGFPILISIFAVLLSFILMFSGFIISSIILAPLTFTTSPWFIIALFFAGSSSLSLVIFIIVSTIRGTRLILKKLFEIPTFPKPTKRVPLSITITLIIISLVTNAAVFTLPFIDSNLRAKLPSNMFQLQLPFSESNQQTFSQDIDAAQIKNLVIQGSGVQIKTNESSDSQYHLKIKTAVNTHAEIIKVENQTLTINKSEAVSCLFCVNFGNNKVEIELSIPKDTQLDTFLANISGGSLEVSYIQAKNATIQIAGGQIALANFMSNNATFDIVGGSIDTNEATIQSTINVKIAGGSAMFETLRADTAHFNVAGGSISVKTPRIRNINKNIIAGSLNLS